MVGLPIEIIQHHVNTYGILDGLRKWMKKAYLRKRTTNSGENVFSKDWGVLIILDACRPDLVDEVAPGFDFLSECSTISSLGSATAEWMPRTFSNADENELQDTIYVTGNPFSDQFLSEDSFTHLDEVWRWGWDKQIGTVPPRRITDSAIEHARTQDFSRLIIHYMQPHVPFLESERSPALDMSNFTGKGKRTLDDWELVELGKRDLDDVWSEYRRNLELVLEEVSILRNNIDGEKMIITSDHGNAIGERGLFGHPGGISIPALYEVPWCETTATDQETHEPADYNRDNVRDATMDLLNALGYS